MAAALVALLLFGVFTFSLALILQRQLGAYRAGAESEEEIVESVREVLEASFESFYGGYLHIRVRNPGQALSKLTKLFVVYDDDRTEKVDLDTEIPVMPSGMVVVVGRESS